MLVLSSAVLLLALLVSPVYGQFKGAWLAPEPAFDFKLGLNYTNTTEWFCGPNLNHCQEGDRSLLNPLAESQSSQIVTQEFELQLAPVRGLAFHAYIPVHFIRFEEEISAPVPAREVSSDGLGDVTALIRGGFTVGNWGFTGSYGWELPTAAFTTNSFEISIGKGTRNQIFLLEAGRSFYPTNAYLQTGLMYLLRDTFVNDFGVEIDWGDEVHARLEGGIRPWQSWWLVLETKGFRSEERRVLNIPGERDDQFRGRWTVMPKVMFQWTVNNWIEGWASFPVAGVNTQAAPTVGAAIYTRFPLGMTDRGLPEPTPGTIPDPG